MTRLMILAPSFLVLAQGLEFPPWLQVTGWASIISLFVWWIWYHTAIAIPAMHRENRAHIETITNRHGETVEKLVNDFRSENLEHRKTCADEKRMLWDQLHAPSRRREPHTPSHVPPKPLPGEGNSAT